MKLQLEHGGVSRARIIGVLMVNLLRVSPAPIPAQSTTLPKSPMEVLQDYRKMDADGERLTVSGWDRASAFFVKPGPPPRRYVMGVMYGEKIYNTRVAGRRAEVWLRRSAIGQIDSSGRFTSVVAPYFLDPSGLPSKQRGTPQIHGLVAIDPVYQLILTDTHWTFGPGRKEPREVKGPLEWRLEFFEPEPWVTIEVAIRYLTQLRDESSSEIIKRNAEKSISTLRRLP